MLSNKEPIITTFCGYFEFVYNNNSLGKWFINNKNIIIFWCIHLGLLSIFKEFQRQKENSISYKLDTTIANFAICKTN